MVGHLGHLPHHQLVLVPNWRPQSELLTTRRPLSAVWSLIVFEVVFSLSSIRAFSSLTRIPHPDYCTPAMTERVKISLVRKE